MTDYRELDAITADTTFTAGDALDLLDWKRTILDAYADVRAGGDPERAWRRWRETRDRLYSTHPQSPLPEGARARFDGCRFYGYDPAFRIVGSVHDAEPETRDIEVSTGGTFSFTRIGMTRFEIRGVAYELEIAWNDGYGGGVFLAFTDSTSGDSTYGGGRYLLDTVKGSDLGFDLTHKAIALDFNYAYNPSCSYDSRWACPLAPPVNNLPIPVTAGERHPSVAPTTAF